MKPISKENFRSIHKLSKLRFEFERKVRMYESIRFLLGEHKWMNNARLRHENFKEEDFREKLISEGRKLAKEIDEIRGKIKTDPIRPNRGISLPFYCPKSRCDPDIWPTPIDLEKIIQAMYIGKLLEFEFLWPIPLPETPCEASSGMLELEDHFAFELSPTYVGTTTSHQEFTYIDQLPDYFGIDFSDFFIDDGSQYDIGDTFTVGYVFRFKFPNKACDGKFRYSYRWSHGWWPNFTNVNFGQVSYTLYDRFDEDGSRDPTNLYGYNFVHGDLVRSGWTVSPYDDRIESHIDDYIKDNQAYLDVMYLLDLTAFGGRVDFSGESGTDFLGHLVFKKQQVDWSPGVYYVFEPTEEE